MEILQILSEVTTVLVKSNFCHFLLLSTKGKAQRRKNKSSSTDYMVYQSYVGTELSPLLRELECKDTMSNS